jgi:hypothetical protein
LGRPGGGEDFIDAHINISSIEPRLYLLTRLIMEIAACKTGVAVPAAR